MYSLKEIIIEIGDAPSIHVLILHVTIKPMW